MEVVVVQEAREEGRALAGVAIGSGVSPLASDGLDEALGLAVGLGAIGSGEEVAHAQLAAGAREEFGAVSAALVGEHALDADAVRYRARPTVARKRSLLIETYDGPHYYEKPSFHTDETIGGFLANDVKKV